MTIPQPWPTLPVAVTAMAVLGSAAPVALAGPPPPVPDVPTSIAGLSLTAGDGTSPEVTPIDLPPEPGQGVALLMGGSGVPIPPVDLARVGFDNYAAINGFGDYAAERLFTPEGLQTIEGIAKQLPFNQSVAQGVEILETEIKKNILGGHDVAVAGVSQSATINAMVLRDIHDGKLDGVDVTNGKLQFVSLGDPSNPNGGILERFNLPQDPNLTLPSLGLTFSGASPADTGVPETIYTLEYDGFADFPRYPINILADLNAVAGLALVHPLYIQGLLAPGAGLTEEQIANAQELPTSPGYDGDTTYLIVPDDNQLPLAQVIGLVLGRPVADLLEPVLRVLVNLGYGADPYIGWSTGPANVPTPIGLFPSIDSDQFNTIMQALSDGAKEGWDNFVHDLQDPASIQSNTLDHLLAGIGPAGGDSGPTDFVSAISSIWSTLNGMASSTNDVVNALSTVLPATTAHLFSEFLSEGDVLNAFGMPAAMATGLEAVALGVETFVVIRNLPDLLGDFDTLF